MNTRPKLITRQRTIIKKAQVTDVDAENEEYDNKSENGIEKSHEDHSSINDNNNENNSNKQYDENVSKADDDDYFEEEYIFGINYNYNMNTRNSPMYKSE